MKLILIDGGYELVGKTVLAGDIGSVKLGDMFVYVLEAPTKNVYIDVALREHLPLDYQQHWQIRPVIMILK